MITLYQRPDCPFCWKVRLALAELGTEFHSVETTLGEQHPDVTRLSPKKSVPVLVDGDSVIWESAVILEYLLDGEQAAELLPDTPSARAQARLLHSYSDSIVGPSLRGLVFEKRAKPEPEWDQELIAQSEQTWRQCQQQLQQWLGDRKYFCDNFSIAECALAPRFAIAEHYGADIPKELEKLKDWYQRLRQRASFGATYPLRWAGSY